MVNGRPSGVHGLRVLVYDRQQFLAEFEKALVAAEAYVTTLLSVGR